MIIFSFVIVFRGWFSFCDEEGGREVRVMRREVVSRYYFFSRMWISFAGITGLFWCRGCCF